MECTGIIPEWQLSWLSTSATLRTIRITKWESVAFHFGTCKNASTPNILSHPRAAMFCKTPFPSFSQPAPSERQTSMDSILFLLVPIEVNQVSWAYTLFIIIHHYSSLRANFYKMWGINVSLIITWWVTQNRSPLLATVCLAFSFRRNFFLLFGVLFRLSLFPGASCRASRFDWRQKNQPAAAHWLSQDMWKWGTRVRIGQHRTQHEAHCNHHNPS